MSSAITICCRGVSGLAELAPPPLPQKADTRVVEPTEAKVTGFVFKIQANMDPKHRDRVAFVRLCSGHFKRGAKLLHVRSGKTLNIHNPVLLDHYLKSTPAPKWIAEGEPYRGK